MIYCDTSLIVSALTSEIHSDAASRWFEENAAAPLCVSEWVGTEVTSALAMKQRRGLLDPVLREQVMGKWRSQFLQNLDVIPIQSTHFRRAARLVDSGARGLRASDALHLAIVIDHGLQLVTLDNDLAEAAEATGVVVYRII